MAAVTYSLDIHYLWQVDVLHFLCFDLMKEEFLLVLEYFFEVVLLWVLLSICRLREYFSSPEVGSLFRFIGPILQMASMMQLSDWQMDLFSIFSEAPHWLVLFDCCKVWFGGHFT